jgi:hypothetical protein
MKPYVLDTDSLTLSEYGHPQLAARVRAVSDVDLAITILLQKKS